MSGNTNDNIDPNLLRLFSVALNNRWPKGQLSHKIVPETPIFVYCPLMFPWVMSLVIDSQDPYEDAANRMTRATLHGHFRTMIKYIHRPTIVKAKKEAAVDGILMTGLTEEERARVEEYIGLAPGHHSRQIEEVEIELADGEEVKVAALVYLWDGPLIELVARHWTPLGYLRNGYVKDVDSL